MSIRERLEKALSGEPIERPVFLTYDWFVKNRPIDWQSLFDQGLGQMNHVDLIEFERPNVEIIKTERMENATTHTDIRWVTDIGELHESFIDEWQYEYLIKSPGDYRIVTRAFSDSKFIPTNKYFDQSEAELGNKGITVGHLGWTSYESRRTALQEIQIDFTGLERFSIDLISEQPELMELIELMNEQMIEIFRCVLKTRAQHIKLWENLTIETMGPVIYRKYLVPIYQRIFAVIEGSDKKLQVHYDGKLSVIMDEIARLQFDGIDSLTPPPEGDMSIAEARCSWTDKFFWMNPSLGWYHLPEKQLINNIKQMVEDAGTSRYCLMISEDVPHDCQRTVPAVLQALDNVT